MTPSSRLPFWSDDFDMDLLKVFPNLVEALGATADVKLWTVGHETLGRLNNPAVWSVAYFWLDKPNLQRDKHGWFKIDGCIDDAPEIECTWLELLRDQWPHHYGWILMPTGEQFPCPPNVAFERLMYHRRGWRKTPEINGYHATAWRWLQTMNLRFALAVERHGLGRDGHPYFAPGAVPGLHQTPPVRRVPMDV